VSKRHVEGVSVRQAPRWSAEWLRARAVEWLAQPDIRAALVATLGLRMLCSLAAAVLPLLDPQQYPWLNPFQSDHFSHAIYAPGTPLPRYSPLDYLTLPWERWDTAWYVDIARHGYTTYGSTAFMPLYPILAHIVAPLFGADVLAAELVISTVAAFFAFLALYRLAEVLAPRRGLGPYALLIAVFLPTSFYFMAAYTESLYLALAMWAVLAALAQQWWRFALLAALAALTRQQGILLSVLVLPVATLGLLWIISWRRAQRPHDVGAALLAGAAPLVAYGGWMAVLRFVMHAPLPWDLLVASDAWNLRFSWPGSGVLADIVVLIHPPKGFAIGSLALDVISTLVALGALLVAVRRLPKGVALYLLAVWCTALIKVLPNGMTVSEGRYMLQMLPLCMVPAAALARSGTVLRLAWIVVGTVTVVVFLWSFVLWKIVI
jgi:hypothetical protein